MASSDTTKTTLRRLAESTPVTDFLGHRDYLAELYRKAKAVLPSYSYLKLAADLGFSETNVMRLVITGERNLTSKAASRIAKALDLHGPMLRYWTTLVKYAEARVPAERERLFDLLVSYKTKARPAELDPILAQYFGEWYHPVIREMVGLPDFDGEATWIQERLAFPLRLDEIRRSLELLEQLAVIKRDERSGLYMKTATIATSPEVDSVAIVRYHQKMIEIGRESITRLNESERDVQAVTVSLPVAAADVLKAKIQTLINETLALEAATKGREDAAEVFQVNVQMFPFTSRKGRVS